MSRIWAIARQTIAEGIRMKIAVVFIAIILLLVVGLPFSLRNEESVSAAVQTFLSFSLTGVGFVLSLLTIFLSRSLSDELVNRQILVMMTKPIPRWQFITGKWLGIVTLNGVILALSGLGIYAGAKITATLTPRDELDASRLRNEVLTARHGTSCVVPDFTSLAHRRFEERLETGGYSDVLSLDRKSEIERIKQDLEVQWRTLYPLEARQFEFTNVRCARSPDRMFQLRYKAEVYRYPPDEILRAEWWVGNPDKGTPLYAVRRRDVVGRWHTFDIPTDAIAPDRTLTAVLHNRNPFEGEVQHDNIITLTSGDDVQVLFTVGTFGGNLFRLLTMMMCKLMFLAILGLTAACVFSFPVACLVTFTFWILASMSAFLTEAITFFDREGVPGVFRDVVGVLYQVAFFIIPDFSKFDGTEMLVDGRNVTLTWVLTAIGQLGILGTGSLGLLACLLFQRREVSEVSV